MRLRYLLPILLALIIGVIAPHPAGAETDAERERERVRQERRDSASNVDALNADKSEIEQALADLNQQVTSEEAALASAEREVEAAEEDEAQAQQGIEEAEERLGELEVRLRAQMVEMYVDPDGGTLTSVLDAASATDMVKRRAILRGRTADDEDLADQVRRAQADLRTQRLAAQEAGARAEDRRLEVETRLTSLEQAREQEQTFAAQVQERIDSELARALDLAERDRALSQQIVQEQARLQALIALQQQQQQQEQERAAAAAAAQPTASYDDDGGESAGPVAPPGGGGVSNVGSGMCNAAGIQVSCQIADRVAAMVNAAAADGVSLSGGGYRDPSRQIALRRSHCGSSYYAIYQMPSSQCRPPTARPGSSNHEVGLAIDFNNCSSRGTACFRWLSGNASRFGMYNLPSEPWHWSVNGN